VVPNVYILRCVDESFTSAAEKTSRSALRAHTRGVGSFAAEVSDVAAVPRRYMTSCWEDAMRQTGLLWMVVGALVIGGCSKSKDANARSSATSRDNTVAVGTGGAGANLTDDNGFVRDIAGKNLAEIELSRLAMNKAIDPNIRFYAQRVVDEHGAAGEKLKSIVSGQPIDWPTQLDDKHRKVADELATKAGADFDREYVKAMVEGHQDLTAKLESRLDVQSVAAWKTAAAGRTENKALPNPNVTMRDVEVRPDTSANEITMKINQWAADTYPIAQKHLDTARALENATKNRATD
jgi:putative membrane protein